MSSPAQIGSPRPDSQAVAAQVAAHHEHGVTYESSLGEDQRWQREAKRAAMRLYIVHGTDTASSLKMTMTNSNLNTKRQTNVSDSNTGGTDTSGVISSRPFITHYPLKRVSNEVTITITNPC